jgi:hypothetical protein
MTTRLVSLSLVVAMAALSAVALAQRPVPIVETERLRHAPPMTAWSPAGPDGQPTQWTPFPRQAPLARELPPLWAVAHDMLHFDFATGLAGQPVYVNPAPTRWYTFHWGTGLPLVNWPFVSNDAIWNPPSKRRFIERIGFILQWNPNGTPSGTPLGGPPANLGVLIRVLDGMGSIAGELDGPGGPDGSVIGAVFLRADNVAPGFFLFGGGMTGILVPPGALPVPDRNGEVQMTIGTFDGAGNFVRLTAPGTAQMGQISVGSPTDPFYPGTNPSDSGGYVWTDDSTAPQGADVFANNIPDWVLSSSAAFTAPPGYREVWESNFALPVGRLQKAMMFAYDQNARLLDGQIVYSGIADPARQPRLQWFTMVPVDAGGVPVGTERRNMRVAVTSTGAFTLIHPEMLAIPGDPASEIQTYRVYVPQTDSFLARFHGEIVDFTTGGSRTLAAPIELINGNVERGDAVIDLADFLMLAASYDLPSTDPGFNANADLNRDDMVDLSDFLLLAANYEAVGDPVP